MKRPSVCWLVLGVALMVLPCFAGCATPPAPPSAFAQCVELVAGEAIYSGDRLRAAQWCVENMP